MKSRPSPSNCVTPVACKLLSEQGFGFFTFSVQKKLFNVHCSLVFVFVLVLALAEIIIFDFTRVLSYMKYEYQGLLDTSEFWPGVRSTWMRIADCGPRIKNIYKTGGAPKCFSGKRSYRINSWTIPVFAALQYGSHRSSGWRKISGRINNSHLS